MIHYARLHQAHCSARAAKLPTSRQPKIAICVIQQRRAHHREDPHLYETFVDPRNPDTHRWTCAALLALLAPDAGAAFTRIRAALSGNRRPLHVGGMAGGGQTSDGAERAVQPVSLSATRASKPGGRVI